MNQQEEAAGVNLMKAFMSFQGNKDFIRELVIPTERNPVDPTASILVLQALCNIEKRVQSGQFTNDLDVELKEILRKWRCESQPNAEYGKYNGRPAHLLRSLNIFEVFGVPLFIDSYGVKQRLSDYDRGIEGIRSIDGNTEIHHVTHKEEADKISNDRQSKPSDNKNIIPGCWFALPADDSFYGSHVFRTTLSALGITGLRQGEIVSYKREVNVILYAVDDGAGFTSLRKPTLEAVKNKHGPRAYVHVSIFVPGRFLPSATQFEDKVERNRDTVKHSMCIKAKRSPYECQESTDEDW